MKKQDLKNFMRVKTKDGDIYIVTRDIAIEKKKSYLNLSEQYDDDLLRKDRDYPEYDIIEIYDKPAKQLVLDHNYKGDLLWKRSEFEPMVVHVPYLWMWEDVEKWAANNGIKWIDRSSQLAQWFYCRENSIIGINADKKMWFGSSKIEGVNIISFADFCEKTGHEPEKWGVRGGKENIPLLKKLLEDNDPLCNSNVRWKYSSPNLLYGMDINGNTHSYYSSEAIEITIEEAYHKMDKEMPKKEEEKIEIRFWIKPSQFTKVRSFLNQIINE